MDKFLHDENLKLLHKRLTETTDEKQRQVLHNLIAEHEDQIPRVAAQFRWTGNRLSVLEDCIRLIMRFRRVFRLIEIKTKTVSGRISACRSRGGASRPRQNRA